MSHDPSRSQPSRVEVTSERTVHDGFLRIVQAEVSWELFDGSMSKIFTRQVVERGDAVAAVVRDTTSGMLLLTRQFRYPVHRREYGWVVELVAGTVEAGRTPEAVMRAEVSEELGYATDSIEPVAVFFLSPGGSSERVHLYYVEVSEEGRQDDGGGLREEGEDIEVMRLTAAEVEALLTDGKIRDAKTFIGLQWWVIHRERQPTKEGTVTGDGRTCFVIMPFGEKRDAQGNLLDFDMVYAQLIKPAVEGMGWKCVRCDDISGAGWIHRDMFESIASADAAIVDITTLNPNVFYELGIRHALRDKVTVLLRRADTDVPFNIEGLRVIDYSPQFRTPTETMERIQRFISTGLARRAGDSPVHEVLDLEVQPRRSEPAEPGRFVHDVEDGDRRIVIVTGDLADVEGADVWVNSENTHMQMARWYDRSISGLIRYLGRTETEDGDVEDTIAAELLNKTRCRPVDAAGVVSTGPGALASRGVKRIFHVAAAEGAPGRGYAPVANIEDCVSNVLREIDDDEELTDVKVLFPLIGTGTAKVSAADGAERLLRPALHFLLTGQTSVSEVWFLAYTKRDLDACLAACTRLGLIPVSAE